MQMVHLSREKHLVLFSTKTSGDSLCSCEKKLVLVTTKAAVDGSTSCENFEKKTKQCKLL